MRVVLWWSKDQVLKSMAMAEWNNGKKFSIGVSHQTQIDRLIHMTDVGFDEFTLTLIQSRLMIEKLNHTVAASRDSSSVLMNYHHILLGITGGFWEQLEWSWWSIILIIWIRRVLIHRKEFRWYRWWDHDISHYHIKMNLTGLHKQELGSGCHQLS